MKLCGGNLHKHVELYKHGGAVVFDLSGTGEGTNRTQKCLQGGWMDKIEKDRKLIALG